MMTMMMEIDENHSTTSSTSSSRGRCDIMPSAVTTKPASSMESFMEHKLLDTFLKASNACDKFFNCAYVTKQLEDEWHQEHVLAVPDVTTVGRGVVCGDGSNVATTATAMNRVWNKMERSFQVEVYRQFLFDESSFDENNSDDDEDSAHDKELTMLLPFCGNESDATSIPDLQRTRS